MANKTTQNGPNRSGNTTPAEQPNSPRPDFPTGQDEHTVWGQSPEGQSMGEGQPRQGDEKGPRQDQNWDRREENKNESQPTGHGRLEKQAVQKPQAAQKSGRRP